MLKPLKLCDLIKAMWGGYSDDVGKALIHMGAAGWFFSALAQLGMIATNENIDKKEKRFLIPQEISDGVINVTLYYTISQGIKEFGEYVLEKGKLLTKSNADFIQKLNPTSSNLSKSLQELSQIFKKAKLINAKNTSGFSSVIEGTINYLKGEKTEAIEALNQLHPELVKNIKNHFEQQSKELNINELKNILKSFNKFKNGIGVIMAVSGSIMSCNMITPICRNISANYFQKKLMNHKKNITPKPHHTLIYRYQLPNTFTNFRI